MRNPSARPCLKLDGDRGFTIVELLVVLLIIALVLGILLPVLGAARNRAKATSTQATLKALASACDSFQLDQRKSPGYFSPAEMGSSENITRGFSAMKNIMLDLAGGLTTAPADGVNVFDVGPVTGSTVRVDLRQIGGNTGTGNNAKTYFNPDRSIFVAQDQPGQLAGATGIDGHLKLPEVLDAWGNPILAWAEDDRQTQNFSAIDSSTTAKFYWASNACFLRATSLGKMARDQNYATGRNSSLLGTNLPAQIAGSGTAPGNLEALLGNPSFPKSKAATSDPDRPSVARGKIVFHSAGTDGFYMGSEDRGGKQAISNAGVVKYSSSIDVMNDFDDITQKSGN